MSTTSSANCPACAALFYARKLLIRGWAGQMTRTERSYTRAHRSPAQQRQAEGAVERLRLARSPAEAPKPHRQTALGPEPDAEVAHGRR